MYGVILHSLLALLTAFALAAALGPISIPMLRALKDGKRRKDRKAQENEALSELPTMGGIILFGAALIGSLLWARDSYAFLLPALLLTALMGMVGYADDLLHVRLGSGLALWQKLTLQSVIAVGFAVLFYLMENVGPAVWLDWGTLGFFYVPLAAAFIVGTVNMARLTEEVNGLPLAAGGTGALLWCALLCMLVQTSTPVKNIGLTLGLCDLAVFGAAIAGGCMGLLLYNTPPARLRIGETGAYVLGGALAALALLSRTGLALPLLGVGFTATGLSVVIQIVSYRMGKALFKATPFHRQLAAMGMPESKIIMVYAIFTVIGGAAAMLIAWYTK